MDRKNTSILNQMINWLIKYNWPVIVLFAVFLLLFEIIEPLAKDEPLFDPYHVAEILFFFVLLILVRVLMDFLIKANGVQSRTLEILNFKHDISLELTKLNNGETLYVELAKIPGRVASVETSRLHVLNAVSEKLELAAQWPVNNDVPGSFHNDCRQCKILNAKAKRISGLCMFEEMVAGTETSMQECCIPIYYGNEILGIIQFRLKPGIKLTSDQVEIFENIRTEIALILKVSQEQSALSEMQLARTALAERRTISTYIHDQLGQNLGYLHLRLDQLLEDENIKNVKNIKVELKRLRDVANDSYGIVRDILKTMRSETVPNFTNLLQEQARAVSRRANFSLDFKSIGKPIPLLPGLQQAIFFSFCEVLSNIERHADANKVDILIAWNDGILDISVADDGKGFESGKVQEENHYGLHIMHERISGVHGILTINSAANSGTVVSISVPVQLIDKVVA